MVSDIYNKTKCDIIGHFDLITKFNEGNALFDASDERYKSAAKAAAEALLKTPAVFEVNTGAMSRGYRDEPYPAKEILDMLICNRNSTICSIKYNYVWWCNKYLYR